MSDFEAHLSTMRELSKMSALYYKEKSKYESLRDSVRITANSELVSPWASKQIKEAIQYSEEY